MHCRLVVSPPVSIPLSPTLEVAAVHVLAWAPLPPKARVLWYVCCGTCCLMRTFRCWSVLPTYRLAHCRHSKEYTTLLRNLLGRVVFLHHECTSRGINSNCNNIIKRTRQSNEHDVQYPNCSHQQKEDEEQSDHKTIPQTYDRCQVY